MEAFLDSLRVPLENGALYLGGFLLGWFLGDLFLKKN